MKKTLLAIAFVLSVPVAATIATGPVRTGVGTQLLYVKFTGPAQARALFYHGDPVAQAFDMPVTVGLRPGYIYRVQLTDIAGRPGLSLFPTVEVRGVVAYPAYVNAAEFPVPIAFSKEDIERVLSGAFITKVYYLEDPCTAFPVATQRDQPIELDVLPTRCIFDEARRCGRTMVILRFGERLPDADELARSAIPGTIQFPGDAAIPQPLVPPTLPWACHQIYDPSAGPRGAFEECICDGGDTKLPVGLGDFGHLRGLDPSDAAAEYECKGCRRIVVSNRCCIFAPRFIALRTEVTPAGYSIVVNPEATVSTHAQVIIEELRNPKINLQIYAPESAVGRIRPSEIDSLTGLLRVEQMLETAEARGVVKGVEVVGVCIKEPPCGPLLLCKWCEPKAARVGDIATFYLKYTNTGGQPMNNVVVSDSLTPRLEYIPGTALSDRDNVFTTQENDGGSLALRWQIGGDLPPGKSGMVRFQAKVR